MRVSVFAMALCFTLSACGSGTGELSASQKTEIENQVMSSFEGLVEAAKSLKPEAYFEYFDKERLTTLNQNGTVTLNFNEFAESYAETIKTFTAIEDLAFKNVKITVIDQNTAVLVNEFTVKVALRSGRTITAGGAGTQVWNKKDRVWKLVHVSDVSRQTRP